MHVGVDHTPRNSKRTKTKKMLQSCTHVCCVSGFLSWANASQNFIRQRRQPKRTKQPSFWCNLIVEPEYTLTSVMIFYVFVLFTTPHLFSERQLLYLWSGKSCVPVNHEGNLAADLQLLYRETHDGLHLARHGPQLLNLLLGQEPP